MKIVVNECADDKEFIKELAKFLQKLLKSKTVENDKNDRRQRYFCCRCSLESPAAKQIP
jgi:hypothetical protein